MRVVFPRAPLTQTTLEVYHLYFSYFFALVRAGRWGAALEAWRTGVTLAPSAPVRTELAPLAAFIEVPRVLPLDVLLSVWVPFLGTVWVPF